LLWQPVSNEKVKNVQLSFMKFTAYKILFQLQDSNYAQIDDFLVDKKDRKYQIWQRNPLRYIGENVPPISEQSMPLVSD
jgi:putative transposase